MTVSFPAAVRTAWPFALLLLDLGRLGLGLVGELFVVLGFLVLGRVGGLEGSARVLGVGSVIGLRKIFRGDFWVGSFWVGSFWVWVFWV